MVDQIPQRVYPPNFEKEYTIPKCDVNDLCKWLLHYFRGKKKVEFKSEWGITNILNVAQKDADDSIHINVESVYYELSGPQNDRYEYQPKEIKLDFILIKIVKTKVGAILSLWARAEFDIITFESQLHEDWIMNHESNISNEDNPSIILTANGSQQIVFSENKRKNKPRIDAAKKIGFVLYVVEKGDFPHPSDVCKRYHFRYDTFENYKDFSITISYKDGFTKDPSSADRYKQALAQKSK